MREVRDLICAEPTTYARRFGPSVDAMIVALRCFLLLSKRNRAILPVGNLKVGVPVKEKPDVLQGTLALMVLKTLDILGSQHGYGIARRIEQISGDLLALNQGTLYPLAAQA